MERRPHSFEDLSSLDETIEKHLENLFDKLARPHTVRDLNAEIAALAVLLDSFSREDEMLEKLLDAGTDEEKRRQITGALNAQSIKLSDNYAELQRLHAKSHQLLERSKLLIKKAQQQLNTEAHTKSKEPTAEELGEEIAALDHWIKQHSETLGHELNEQVSKSRRLMRAVPTESEMETELKKTDDLKKEIDSLNELRQVRELKAALLRKLSEK